MATHPLEHGTITGSDSALRRSSLGSHPSIHEVVGSVAATGARRLLTREVGVRDDVDPEDVHQARVATRRLRADLRSLRPALDREWTDRIRSELRWLGGLLGEVRDLDVLAAHVADELATLDDRDRRLGVDILVVMREQRELRHLELLGAMSSDRYHALIDDLVAAAGRPPLGADVDGSGSGRRLLRAATASAWRRTAAAARRLEADAPLEEVHELRKRTKRARYAAQLSAPVFGKPAHRLATRLGELQDELGELNDAVTLTDWLDREAGGRLDGPAAYLAGRIAERQDWFIATHHDEWRSTWTRIRPKHTAWLK